MKKTMTIESINFMKTNNYTIKNVISNNSHWSWSHWLFACETRLATIVITLITVNKTNKSGSIDLHYLQNITSNASLINTKHISYVIQKPNHLLTVFVSFPKKRLHFSSQNANVNFSELLITRFKRWLIKIAINY